MVHIEIGSGSFFANVWLGPGGALVLWFRGPVVLRSRGLGSAGPFQMHLQVLLYTALKVL